mgnify:CR=1 FL=1
MGDWDGLKVRVLSETQKKNRSQFWTPKKRYYPTLFVFFFIFKLQFFQKKSKKTKKNNSNTEKYEFLFHGST